MNVIKMHRPDQSKQVQWTKEIYLKSIIEMLSNKYIASSYMAGNLSTSFYLYSLQQGLNNFSDPGM